MTVGTVALPTAAAVAAPPPNDDFANRQALVGALPISVAGTNLEATREAGEPPAYELEIVQIALAGRSVWYSWTATSSEWVTISTCGSGFDTMLDVYTGTALFNLEKVSKVHEGPGLGCDSGGTEMTFRAAAGATYAIRVDGNLSLFPPDQVEGPVALRIYPTPSPGNDAFAAAQVVAGESLEGGAFHRVDVPGYNWNATKETGEPAHAGDPGGGSVWYSWTAPASGKASVRVAAGTLKPAVDVYTGDSLTGLTSVAIPTYTPDTVDFAAIAGTTYRIAVDGRLDSATGLPSMGHLTFLLFLDSPLPPAADATPPETTIRRVVRQRKRVTLRFASSEAGSSFRCKRDRLRFAACASPKTYAGLKPGRHTFRVIAVDAAGNLDGTAAVARMTIPRPREPKLSPRR